MAITPQKLTSNTRWQIVEAFTSALSAITKAAGYNTQPRVTRDFRLVKSSSEDVVVVVSDGSETALDFRNNELELTVTCFCKAVDIDPAAARCSALQDVRTAVMGDRATLAAACGTGVAISLGRCDTDEGLFLDNGYAMVEQTFLVKYPQGSIW